MRTTTTCLLVGTLAGLARAQDATAPVITCPEDTTLQADESCSASFSGPAATATDNQDEDVSIEPDLPIPLGGPGEHIITWTATDDAGNEATCEQVVTIEDVTAPTLTSVSATPSCLWPPNHRFVAFRLGDNVIVEASDNCDEVPAVQVGDIQSSEPEDGRGDGNTDPDALVVSDGFCLRSERSGAGDGRQYTVRLQVVDASGNGSEQMLEIGVGVMHDQRAHDCPSLVNSAFVEESDSTCAIVGDGDTAAERRQAGCSAAPSAPPGSAIGVLLLGLAAVRMRRR